jgi:hypothetical protein
MDLSRWSLGALLREARRLGVSRPDSLTRQALVRRILRAREPSSGPQAQSAPHSKRRGGLVGRFMNYARAAWSRGSQQPRLAGANAPEPQTSSPASPPPEREPARTAEPHPNDDPAPRPGAATPSSEPVPQPPQSSPPPSGGEPIETKTMAHLLAEQGHTRRALGIYHKLLEQRPGDPELEGLIEKLRNRRRDEGKDPNGTSGHDQEVVSVAVDAQQVLVSWAVHQDAIARARQLLGGPGALTARLVVVAPDDETVVRSETRERRDVPHTGEWVVDDLPPGTRATASVGLTEGERFVSIAHARTIRPQQR